ncbi:putative ATPase/DNA-binding SARP family transcriptional activator [Kibdelosporangium banguiense]|uniref:ATPase/DNA-binding SARP family transcriptional activator n=1 Tax=Kibdelosporangium banguiense TaxID=1365924 RepID=A0ABS4T987_9PSEU|nr:BTAD domain-containing putative transcriptional regulator [Kibdelosporangium banguiense]MBP2320987.1 putative ATPase/DNA-binding SARP family transcriptional activator [Kibdelosporangium banguiense]
MQIGILGPLAVTGAVAGARLRALLIALALEPGQVVSMSRLIDGVWAQDPPAKASNALQVLVSRLRKADLPIESQPAGYRLALDPDEVDATRFERLVTAARSADDATKSRLLREALGLWRGPALQDVADEEFFQPRITRLNELRLTAIEDRAEAELRLGEDPTAKLTALMADNPLRERMAGALMRALAASGRANEALTVYETTREALAEQLGADPSPELSALHTSILRAEQRPKTNIRTGLTTFVGRGDDVSQVRKLVGDHRLTTLTGLGGTGKTRMAIEVARTLLDQTPDGVWLAEFAPVTAGDDLAQVVLGTVGLREGALIPKGEPIDRLTAAMSTRNALLVLDNCEHVIDAAAALAERLLGECPRLRILATSREPLNITGEALWPVEPLALPPDNSDIGTAMSSDAVRLLSDRASAMRPGFVVDEQTVEDVVRICRALDGMPLALELAAVRLRTMTPAQVASRLDDRFQLLTGGSRVALPRHQTLRAMVDWSWELLSDRERAVLRRFAVFSGGATLEAAEQVCGGDVLAELADKSLLVPGERYQMLETIKAYCLEKLAEAGELGQTRQAHAKYFLGLVETADPGLRGTDQLTWLARLTADHDNINAALRNAIAIGAAQTAAQLAATAGWYWWLSSHQEEGVDLTTAALALPGADEETRAAAYAVAALLSLAGNVDANQATEFLAEAQRFAGHQESRYPLLRLVWHVHHVISGTGPAAEPDKDPWVEAATRLQRAAIRLSMGHRHAEVESDLDAAVSGFHVIGDRWGYAFALTNLASLVAWRGDIAAAITHHEQAVQAAAELGANEDMVLSWIQLAQLRWQLGDTAACTTALTQAEREAAKLGVPSAQATVAYGKAEVMRWAGDLDAVRNLLAKAEVLARHVSINWGIRVAVAGQQGYLHAEQGDLDAARERHAFALDMVLGTPNSILIAHIVVGIADLALRQGKPAESARLLAAADAIRGTPDLSHPDARRVKEQARAALGEQLFTEAAQRGRNAAPSDLPEIAKATLG